MLNLQVEFPKKVCGSSLLFKLTSHVLSDRICGLCLLFEFMS